MTLATSEKATQRRVIDLFTRQLGYRYLGDWTDRKANSNVESAILASWLQRTHSAPAVARALDELLRFAHDRTRGLRVNNEAVWKLLRYGVQVKVEAGRLTETVWLVDWEHPERNDFAIAEEVTLDGNHERRPDLVLYVNGIAFAVIELKNSRVSVGDGIRQSLSNQTEAFHAWFFGTIQLVLAGNDSQGLRYGAIGTQEKHFLTWKEDEGDDAGSRLDKYLAKLCRKERLLELVRDFVLFDGGVKKLPRVHQYFGLKAAQEHVRRREGGIIWHTQGSGKSILMVLLARWILEHDPAARVVVITDRDELDQQIEQVFTNAGEAVKRTRSGRDLLTQLGKPTPRLLCSLVHKFGRRDVDDFDAFLRELQAAPTTAVGNLFVFVDECHRTQSGRLHRTMKAMLPGAVFIGFTGTPLLRQDQQQTVEVFGSYIHRYQFTEAVEDKVVLDLVYEARDVNQRLGSPAHIDGWFESRTKSLNPWQKDELKKQWGTMQKVLSSTSRMDQIVTDIVFDFSAKPRLSSERGNAILVASSIYEACRYFELCQRTVLKGRCAVITSYDPHAGDVTLEETGTYTKTDRQLVYDTYVELLKGVAPQAGMSATETYEQRAKKLFVEEPAHTKLLIVVDKLLTGFDAPSCTYLYIDKTMQDHSLFQAICRTNRLDTDDKDFGYIVDYKDLFKKVEKAISVYTAELVPNPDGTDPSVLLHDRLTKGRERLDAAVEAFVLVCEPVEPPRRELEHIRWFCGNPEVPADLADRAPQRAALYKAVVALVRAYANLADELDGAGYTPADVARIKATVKDAVDLREIIRNASGETLDLKTYEADMRHLLDKYVIADAPRTISPFENIGLMDLIVKTGVAAAIAERLSNVSDNRAAVAETIENNVRAKITTEQTADPAFYEKMSALLDEVIRFRKERADAYEEYLKRIAELVAKVQAGRSDDTPARLDTPGKRALYGSLQGWTPPDRPLVVGESGTDPILELALALDRKIKEGRPDAWRGTPAKEREIQRLLMEELHDREQVQRIYSIVQAQGDY